MNSLNEITEFIKGRDNFVILTHIYPDGDTLGSAYALCRALRKLKKNAKVLIHGDLADKYSYLEKDMKEQVFDCETVVTVDIASPSLMGDFREEYEDKIDVCIDHHAANDMNARMKYVDADAASNCENIYRLIELLDIEIDPALADCIYTGICTDTGCFKFTNVTPDTMRIAAKLMECGCRSAEINRVMFDTKSLARINIEREVLNTLRFYADNKIAVVYTTRDMEKRAGAVDQDLEGIAAIPRQIEGVCTGVTLKEKGDNYYRISVRTNGDHNASMICGKLGGGGHFAAAGCSVNGTLEEAIKAIVRACVEELGR